MRARGNSPPGTTPSSITHAWGDDKDLEKGMREAQAHKTESLGHTKGFFRKNNKIAPAPIEGHLSRLCMRTTLKREERERVCVYVYICVCRARESVCVHICLHICVREREVGKRVKERVQAERE